MFGAKKDLVKCHGGSSAKRAARKS